MLRIVLFKVEESSCVLLTRMVRITEVIKQVCVRVLNVFDEFIGILAPVCIELASSRFKFVGLTCLTTHL